MLTNGWRKFNWEKLKASIAPEIKYPVETDMIMGFRQGLWAKKCKRQRPNAQPDHPEQGQQQKFHLSASYKRRAFSKREHVHF